MTGEKWWREHQEKMIARKMKRRENKRLREKGRHPVTKEIWSHIDMGNEVVVKMVKELDMELWRTEEL